LVLAPAEMAVVFQHMLGPTTAGSELLADSGLEPPARAAARQRMLERGLLRPAPNRALGQTFIAPDARALFGAVTRPLMLGVLQIMQPGQDERGAYVSWTPDLLVFNTVDAHGNHRLEPLASLEAVADRTLAVCGLDAFKPAPAPLPASANRTGLADALGRAAGLRVIFMTVASARTANEKVSGLAWLISAGQLWLMAAPEAGPNGAPAAPGKAPAAGLRALSPSELRALVLGTTQQAVADTRQALAGAGSAMPPRHPVIAVA
jgi:hypothetical protein